MNEKRYKELNGPDDHELTDDEIKSGWHFCHEFDGLCRNSNEEEFKCTCNKFQNIQPPDEIRRCLFCNNPALSFSELCSQCKDEWDDHNV
jgi:hypothetical protein